MAFDPSSRIRHSRSYTEKRDSWQQALNSKPRIHALREFISVIHTIDAVADAPLPEPLDIDQCQRKLHPYFRTGSHPKTHKFMERVSPSYLSNLRHKYGRKGTVIPRHYPSTGVCLCSYCGRFTHQSVHCECRPVLKNLSKKQLQFVKFLKDLPKQIWVPFSDTQEECAARLPAVWDRLCVIAHATSTKWGQPIPMSAAQRLMYPWRAVDAIFMKYALGFPSDLLIMEFSFVETTRTKKARVVVSGEPLNFYEPKYRYRLPTVHNFCPQRNRFCSVR
jgi:hypothetical protein